MILRQQISIMAIQSGYIQLYTGDGKGKTTAAIGLAIRAAGAGKIVFIAQFVKGMHYSELDILKMIPSIRLKQYGRKCFIKDEPTPEDIRAARRGMKEVDAIVKNNECDVLILDEITIALSYELISFEHVVDLLTNKPVPMEIVLTGRYASPELVKFADLVTEMKEIKHYYRQGVEARTGIEY
jgi:cob(I)alamin adenosyltransferase